MYKGLCAIIKMRDDNVSKNQSPICLSVLVILQNMHTKTTKVWKATPYCYITWTECSCWANVFFLFIGSFIFCQLVFYRLLIVTETALIWPMNCLQASHVPALMVIYPLKLDCTVPGGKSRSIDSTTCSYVASMKSTYKCLNTNTTTWMPMVSKLLSRSKWNGFITTNQQSVITTGGS